MGPALLLSLLTATAPGDCDVRAALAAKNLSTLSAPCRAVAEGWQALDAGEPKRAAERFLDGAEGLKSVRAELRHVAARAHLQARELEEAEALAKKLKGEARDWLRFDLAVARGDMAAAAKAVWGRKLDAAALATLGRWKELFLKHPASPVAKTFEDTRLEGAGLSEKERVLRAERLLKSSRYRRALKELRALSPGGREVREKWADLLVQALVRTDAHEEALTTIVGFGREDKESVAFAWTQAWTLGKVGRPADAADQYARAHELAVKRPARAAYLGKGVRAELCFYSGFLAFEADDFKTARARLTTCEPEVKGTAFAAFGLWYRAFMDILEGEHKSAVVLLERLVNEHPRDREVDKHRYWLARTYEALGGTGARDRLLKRIGKDPTTYYGLLAFRRLGVEPPAGVALPADAFAQTAAKSRRAERAKLLYDLLLEDDARAAAESTRSVALSQAVGDYHRAWRRGGRHVPRTTVKRGKVVESAGWRASYATPWGDIVDGAARERGVPRDLVYAIMRTESGFMEGAVSVVGALGLMQLMPYTARGLAEVLKQEAPDPSTLVSPEVNIPLGTAFLGISLKELGHPALAAGGYNGSPHNVARWLAKFGDLEPELFVERVPFKETRNYIKRVSSVSAVYRALEGEPLAIDLPREPFGKREVEVTWFPRTLGDD
jgi:soluble lytic murein transglycosylase-like protein